MLWSKLVPYTTPDHHSIVLKMSMVRAPRQLSWTFYWIISDQQSATCLHLLREKIRLYGFILLRHLGALEPTIALFSYLD